MNRKFDDFRKNRTQEAVDSGALDKKLLQRIGESADGRALRDYLETVVRSSSRSLDSEELIGHEARRRFASELMHLMEPSRAKPKKTSNS